MPATWTVCRRCGTPLVESAGAEQPAPVAVAAAVGAAATHEAPEAPPAGAHRAGTPLWQPVRSEQLASIIPARDSLLPREPPRDPMKDNLLPRPAVVAAQSAVAARRVAARRQEVPRGRLAAIGIAVVVIMAGGIVASQTVLRGGTAPRDVPAHAQSLPAPLRGQDALLGATHALDDYFLAHPSFTKLTPAQLRSTGSSIHWVAGDVPASSGAVSVRAIDEQTVVLATATGGWCVFERHRPTSSTTEFMTFHAQRCDAASAPDTGWSPEG